MNFKEALQKKQELGEYLDMDQGMKGKIFVTPSDYPDLYNYLNHYTNSYIDDNTSKLFSHNNDFNVYAIWTDGANTLYKKLIK